MNRAERRRNLKNDRKAKTATYNLTKKQLDDAIERGVANRIKEMKKELSYETVNTTMALTFGIPMKVLMDEKYSDERMEKFMEKMLDLYTQWGNGDLDVKELRKDLWDKCGLRFEEESYIPKDDEEVLK